MKKILLFFIFLNLLAACKKADAPTCADCLALYFENPQPNKDSELERFPNKFRGLYISDDSTFIRIEESRILKEYFYKSMIHKLALDSLKKEFNSTNGKLVLFKAEYDLKPKGDSIVLIRKDIDTLFRFSLNQKAKRIDGQLILMRRDSIFWTFQFLSIKKSTINFKSLYEREDLKKLDSVTKVKGKMIDSTSYLIKPTRSELKKILKIKRLGTDEEYKKVSK